MKSNSSPHIMNIFRSYNNCRNSAVPEDQEISFQEIVNCEAKVKQMIQMGSEFFVTREGDVNLLVGDLSYMLEGNQDAYLNFTAPAPEVSTVVKSILSVLKCGFQNLRAVVLQIPHTGLHTVLSQNLCKKLPRGFHIIGCPVQAFVKDKIAKHFFVIVSESCGFVDRVTHSTIVDWGEGNCNLTVLWENILQTFVAEDPFFILHLWQKDNSLDIPVAALNNERCRYKAMLQYSENDVYWQNYQHNVFKNHFASYFDGGHVNASVNLQQFNIPKPQLKKALLCTELDLRALSLGVCVNSHGKGIIACKKFKKGEFIGFVFGSVVTQLQGESSPHELRLYKIENGMTALTGITNLFNKYRLILVPSLECCMGHVTCPETGNSGDGNCMFVESEVDLEPFKTIKQLFDVAHLPFWGTVEAVKDIYPGDTIMRICANRCDNAHVSTKDVKWHYPEKDKRPAG